MNIDIDTVNKTIEIDKLRITYASVNRASVNRASVNRADRLTKLLCSAPKDGLLSCRSAPSDGVLNKLVTFLRRIEHVPDGFRHILEGLLEAFRLVLFFDAERGDVGDFPDQNQLHEAVVLSIAGSPVSVRLIQPEGPDEHLHLCVGLRVGLRGIPDTDHLALG